MPTLRSRLHPSAWLAFVALCVACLLFGPGCATSTRVRITSPQRTVDVVFPKDLAADGLAFDLDPATGEVRFRAQRLRSSASRVIESTAGAISEVTSAATALAPLAK